MPINTYHIQLTVYFALYSNRNWPISNLWMRSRLLVNQAMTFYVGVSQLRCQFCNMWYITVPWRFQWAQLWHAFPCHPQGFIPHCSISEAQPFLSDSATSSHFPICASTKVNEATQFLLVDFSRCFVLLWKPAELSPCGRSDSFQVWTPLGNLAQPPAKIKAGTYSLHSRTESCTLAPLKAYCGVITVLWIGRKRPQQPYYKLRHEAAVPG